jgi:hypothetical protein
MRHEIGEAEEPKKGHKKVAGRQSSGVENHDQSIDPDLSEIEPADFSILRNSDTAVGLSMADELGAHPDPIASDFEGWTGTSAGGDRACGRSRSLALWGFRRS